MKRSQGQGRFQGHSEYFAFFPDCTGYSLVASSDSLGSAAGCAASGAAEALAASRRRAIFDSVHMATATKTVQANMKVATKFNPMAEPKGAARAMAANPATICHPLKLPTDQA